MHRRREKQDNSERKEAGERLRQGRKEGKGRMICKKKKEERQIKDAERGKNRDQNGEGRIRMIRRGQWRE